MLPDPDPHHRSPVEWITTWLHFSPTLARAVEPSQVENVERGAETEICGVSLGK